MSNQANSVQRDFFANQAEVDRRMAEIKDRLQPHFDRSALSADQQASFYEHMRGQIPVTIEQESRGVSPSQLANARQARLQSPYQITEQELNHVLLPSLRHINYIPDRAEFIRIVVDNYKVLMKCEQEGVTRVNALYGRTACGRCHNNDSEIMDAAQILAAIRAGIYPFAHVICDGDEAVYLCPGPKLMLFDNGIDAAKHQKFMAGVKASQEKYQAEAVAKLKGNS